MEKKGRLACYLIHIYKKFIGNKFIIKLFLSYSIIIGISLFITGNIISNFLVNKMVDDEVKDQNILINNMKKYTEDKLDRINQLMMSLYNSYSSENYIVETLKSIEQSSTDSNYPDSYKLDITNTFLYGMVRAESDIADIIILDSRDGLFFHASPIKERSVSKVYDFSEDRVVKNLKEVEKQFNIFSYGKPGYIIESPFPVVTFAGNIVDFQNGMKVNKIGKYMFNFNLRGFDEAYNRLSGNTKSEFYIIGPDRRIIYARNSEMVGVEYTQYDEAVNNGNKEKLAGRRVIISHGKIDFMDITLLSIISEDEVVKDAEKVRYFITIVVFISLVIAMAVTFAASRIFSSRIRKIVNSMHLVQEGNLDTRIKNKSEDEIGQLAIMFNQMCERLKEYINRVYISEIKTRKSEIHALQSKINPHFLYNTIETIRMKALEYNAADISEMMAVLGRLFRWNVSGSSIIISLEEEIEYVSMYFKIHQIRYQHKISMHIELEKGIKNLGIPKFLLQPIIENSVHHGLAGKDDNGEIRIKGYIDGHRLIIEVIDDGTGMDDRTLDSVIQSLNALPDDFDDYYIGLSNVNSRLKLLFGDKYGIDITSERGKYTRVTVKLPAIQRKDMGKYVQAFDS